MSGNNFFRQICVLSKINPWWGKSSSVPRQSCNNSEKPHKNNILLVRPKMSLNCFFYGPFFPPPHFSGLKKRRRKKYGFPYASWASLIFIIAVNVYLDPFFRKNNYIQPPQPRVEENGQNICIFLNKN